MGRRLRVPNCCASTHRPGRSPSIRTAPSRVSVSRRAERALVLGAPTPGGVPLRGMLQPDVAAQLQSIFDAHLAPKVAFDDPFTPVPDGDDIPAADDRSRAQRQHDAFAAALAVAAASGELPDRRPRADTRRLGRRSELAFGTGYAHVQGCDEPVSMQVARHIGCSAVIQRVAIIKSQDHADRRGAAPRLQPLPASRDRPPRRRLHHPRMRSAGRVVRDPSRHGARPRGPDPHRQRGKSLIRP